MSFTEREAQRRVEERIASFAALERGWDGYGAPPITREAIEAALCFLRASAAGPPEVAPTTRGGILVSWLGEDYSVEIGADGRQVE